MAQGVQVRVEGLKELRRVLRAAEDATPREVTAVLKEASVLVAARASSLAPRRTGTLAGGYRPRASGTKAEVINAVPYAQGAEWGRRGKWRGFLKYGPPGRFLYRAAGEEQEAVVAKIAAGVHRILTQHGWLKG